MTTTLQMTGVSIYGMMFRVGDTFKVQYAPRLGLFIGDCVRIEGVAVREVRLVAVDPAQKVEPERISLEEFYRLWAGNSLAYVNAR